MKKYLSFIFAFSLVFVFGLSVLSLTNTAEACDFGQVYDRATGTPCSVIAPCATPSVTVNHITGRPCGETIPSNTTVSANTSSTITLGSSTRPNPRAPITQVLRRGSTGPMVGFLQGALIASGLLSPDSQIEVFGPRTLQATIEFQRRAQLRADGIVGNGTWRALQSITNRLADPYILYMPTGADADGVRDDLVGQVPNECPKGTTGAYPDCLTEDAPETTCGVGYTGTYPNCVPVYVSDTAVGVTSSEGVCSGTSYPNIGLSITVTFAQAVTVTGAPQIHILADGLPLTYSSGSGTNKLTFVLPTPVAGTTNPYPSTAYVGTKFGFKPLSAGSSIKVTATGANANLAGEWNLPAPLVKCITPATPAPVCPTGYTGTYPNCVPPPCPAGTTGTYPNCTTTPVVTTGCPYIGNVGGGTPSSCSTPATFDAVIQSQTGSCSATGITLNVSFSKPVTVTGTPALGIIAGGALFEYVSGSGTSTLVFTLPTASGYTAAQYYAGTKTFGFVLEGGDSIKTVGSNITAHLSGSYGIPETVQTCLSSLVGTASANLPSVTELTYQPTTSGVDYYVSLSKNVTITGNQLALKIKSSYGTEKTVPFVSLLNGYILKFHSDTASSAPAFAGQATIQVSAGSSIQTTSGVTYSSAIPASWLYFNQ